MGYLRGYLYHWLGAFLQSDVELTTEVLNSLKPVRIQVVCVLDGVQFAGLDSPVDCHQS